MVKLTRFIRKTACAAVLTMALIGGLSFNNFNTLLINAATTGTVNTSALNVRSGPSTDYDRITTISKGTTLTIIATEGDWYKVEVGGKTGYVAARYVAVNGNQTEDASGKTGTVNVSVLNIREGAGTSTKCIGSLRNGTKVSIIAAEGEWYKVQGGGKTGYVFAEYVTVGGDDSSSGSSDNSDNSDNSGSTTPDGTGKNGKCNVTALNVRSKATTASSVVGSLSKDTVVEITATEGDWYKINATLNGRAVTGYVFAEYITLTDEKPAQNPSDDGNNDNTSVENNGKSGKCNTYALNVRKGAGTNHAVIGSLAQNEKVTIQETKDGWYKVKVDGRKLTGYVSAQYITIIGDVSNETPSEKPDVKPDEKPQDDTYTEVNESVWATDGVNIRKGPGTNYGVIGSLVRHGSVTRIGVGSNGWSKVNYGSVTGYIKSEYLTTTNPNPGSGEASGEAVVKFALQFEGNPYVWGGNDLNSGVDCSGFTQQVYLKFGIQLNRTADAQRSNGRSVSMSEIQPGDLVFYGSGGYAGHVGLYIGDGKIIHASTPATGIIISNVNYRTPMQINRVIG